jgi:FdhD protein
VSEAPARSIEEVEVDAVRAGRRARRRDALAVEEPLEVHVRHGPPASRAQASLGLTMRTPGHDEELVAGLLLSEGVVNARRDLARFVHAPDRDGHPDPNALVAELAPHVAYDPRANERRQVRSSACGVCGRASLDALAARGPPTFGPSEGQVPDAALRRLPEALRGAQRVFAETGGLHAAALFDSEGSIRSLREDVGRHNAVDKLVGSEFLAGRTPVRGPGLVVSGRASYEILQKALVAGLPLVAAMGAPSSLAVQLADEFGQTLVGFLKPESYNVYTHPRRVT